MKVAKKVVTDSLTLTAAGVLICQHTASVTMEKLSFASWHT